jgi:hypothetical protein
MCLISAVDPCMSFQVRRRHETKTIEPTAPLAPSHGGTSDRCSSGPDPSAPAEATTECSSVAGFRASARSRDF